MVLRTARRGRNRGGQFYGCQNYPRCQGTLPVLAARESNPVAQPTAPPFNAVVTPTTDSQLDQVRPRVQWSDGSTRLRDGWNAWFVPVGGGFRAFMLSEAAQDLSRNTWVAVSRVDSYEPVDDDTVRVCSMLRKLLQRGSTAPVTPSLERSFLRELGVATPAPDNGAGDLAPSLDHTTSRTLSARRPARPFPDHAEIGELAWDSDEERRFHTEWVPNVLGYGAARWFVPQAALDGLLLGRGAAGVTAGARRVDFLVTPPGQRPFVVEIDGQQHDVAAGVDDARDGQLASVGIDTIRVPADEARAGGGPALDSIIERWQEPGLSDDETDHWLLAPAQINRFLLALTTAVEEGFLLGDRWVIELDDELGLLLDRMSDCLELLSAVDDLWGRIIAPSVLWVSSAGEWTRLERIDGSYRPAEAAEDAPPLDVRLILDASVGPLEALPAWDGVPVVVTRPAVLPVEVRMEAASTTRRVSVKTARHETEAALSTVLRWVFAKSDFREGQLEALLEVLEGRDAVVLLPTGAGKSLIYQLAGLLLPGVTLVVDPIVALMDDQTRSLAAQGIDRVLGISSHQVQAGFGAELLARIGAGDTHFVFVAPERLQQQSFRDALGQLSATTMVNLAVVDEAHCVSEWGHDFRTAYLRLGSVLRRVCKDGGGQPPPLLALTGTASRSVLRDVLFELEIDAGASPHTMIRPGSFDRPELTFEISVGDSTSSEARLKGIVQVLPQRFRQRQDFFASQGLESNCGIVFTPHVNGSFGVADVAELLVPVVGYRPTVYAGSPPRRFGIGGREWGHEKRRNAERFKANDVPTLVATKSFGMGIDKPNIRWIVHYGIPGSIEAYYQEAGRAGRDRKRAHCTILFSEFSEALDRVLLDAEADIESIRTANNELSRRESDDVTRMLYFHLNSFNGIEEELKSLRIVLAELGEMDRPRIFELPMGEGATEREARERAIHRLVVLGVAEDYTVDWGSKCFTVRIHQTTPDAVRSSLLAFIARTQPARVPAISARLDGERWRTLDDAVDACGRELMEFVYDTIAASRLRSLREMWLAARQGDGDELRRRILDYLSEGDGAPRLEQLLDLSPFTYADWIEALGEIHLPDDATEWRGASARLLVSEPDHPGLLLVRAVTELLAPGGSSAEFRSNLQASFENAERTYGFSGSALLETADWVDRLLREDPRVQADKRQARPLIRAALLTLADQQVAQTFTTDRVLERPDPDAALAVSFLADELDASRSELARVVTTLHLDTEQDLS
jgi:ATP-dependent DNA helicase RecQ